MLTGVDEFLGVKLRYPIKGSSNDVSYKYLAFYVPEEIININNLVTKSRDDIGSFFYLSINYRQEDSWFEQRYTSKCICCGKTSSNSEYSHILDNWFQLTFPQLNNPLNILLRNIFLVLNLVVEELNIFVEAVRIVLTIIIMI